MLVFDCYNVWKVGLLDIASNQVIRSFHGDCEFFLVIVEQRSVGHHHERNLIPKHFQDGARPCLRSVMLLASSN
jgi:hypothetical protein